MSSMNEIIGYLKGLYTDFSTKTGTDLAVAIILPLILIAIIVFAILMVKLIINKRALKANLNKTPNGSPQSSDSEVSIEKADIIPRPSSVV